MRIGIAIILVVATIHAFAQSDVQVGVPARSKYDSTRSIYIRSYPDHFFIWPVLKQRQLEFRIEDVPSNDSRLIYRPNRPYSFGMGVYLFELVLELAGSLPVSSHSEEIYGESRARDLQLNIFGKKWGLDLYRQKYEGFYIVDPNKAVPADTPFPQRPDIYTRNLYGTVSYTFNNKKFSLRSAYNFTERQLKSSGSFLLFGSLNGFKTRGDSALLGPEYQSKFGTDAKIMEIRSTHLGVAPAYSYSLIHSKGFFINGLFALGPASNWIKYKSEGGGELEDLKFSYFYVARIAMGYNGDKFFTGVSYGGQSTNARFESVRLRSSTGTLKILVGIRFREIGVLKHRVAEIPKWFGF
ncbi:MAG TPA: DUF4421 family protein [Chryseolinea sp.]|nr:DUF4421 family protein [Chryseolinea sp.]